MIDKIVELVDRQTLVPHEIVNQAGIDITASSCHHQPRGWSEAHGRLDASAFVYRCEARPRTEVSKDHAATGCLRAADPGQFLHQVGKRKAVETIASDPRGIAAPRDRDDLRDAW
jgi:hypothetical protein